MAEHHDGGVTGQAGDIVADEVELVCAEVAELFQGEGVDQRDDVHALDVEAVPAVAVGAGPEGGSVFLPVVIDRVVLAGHGEDLSGAQPAQHLGDLVELGRGGQVRQIAGVHHEVRAEPQGVDLVDGAAKRAGHASVFAGPWNPR